MKKELFSFFDKKRGKLDHASIFTELIRMAQITISENKEDYKNYDKKRILKKVQDQKLNLSWGINSFSELEEEEHLKLFEILESYSINEIRKIYLEIFLSNTFGIYSLSLDSTKNLLSRINSSDELNIILADTVIERYELINKRGSTHLYFKNQGMLPLAHLLFDKHITSAAYNDLADVSFEGNNFIHLGPYGVKAELGRNQLALSFPKGAFIQEVEILHLLSSIKKPHVIAVIPAASTFTQSSKYFRDKLLHENHINTIEELPPKSFSALGIQTFILDIGGTTLKKKIQIKAHNKSSLEITENDLKERDEWNLLRFYSTGYVISEQTIELDSLVKDSFRGPPVKKAKQGEKLYLVQNKDLKSNDYVDCEALEEDIYETNRNLERYYLQDGDLLLVCRGHSFETAIVKNIENKKVVCSQNIVALRVEQKKADPYFLYLFLQSPLGQIELKARQVGSAQLVLSIKDIQTIKAPMLPLKEQKLIGKDYLSAKNKRDQALKTIEKEFEENTQKVHSRMGIVSDK